ncbi:aldo/keto reductase [Legionella oakridgensis]|uniref:Aldo/keto reductase n=2 Tax=Legionella oakridgensis TaxID=29423 RepID=A0A0W0X4Q9_9GAMM|nr:aldo/keto reductase [Legionella oakridgensis]AHE66925.1 putative oxidoreductase [Legionella oakridgensis ATCC 33761 = DSM 21215]ETO93381.1 putative oxidoreductase [Legionella oakridgensis RV-2-2007]KTD39494.1 aldo/keto reductase [Legionella oakridgensis]STY20032.1 aldo/keto reductase [Legionella longbeachae]
MRLRKLGRQGLEVSALGLGCMGMSYAYGSADQTECLRVLDRALELGVNFFDTAEVYGPYKNEELIGNWLNSKPRASIVIATKFGFTWNSEGFPNGVNSKPEHIRQSIDGSLKRLKTDYIDLYYQHRLDPETPIEDTVATLADLVKEGKIRYIGLSEVGSGIIRRAHSIHPITAVQSEYSLWDRNVEDDILPTLNALGIGFVPYSPLGRGFFSGQIHSTKELEEGDFRQMLERFHDENLKHNFKLIELLQELATKNNVTPTQISLAWLLKQGNNIVPIPGTKRLSHLEDNLQATHIVIPTSDWDKLGQFLATFKFAGERYPEAVLKLIDRTP